MNLKLVAVSMSVLGLISSPVFADDTTMQQKHKHHRKHHHHHHVAHHDYKATGALPVAAPVAESSAPMAATSVTSAIMDQMGQNTAMNKPAPEWFNRIGVSGGFNLDTGKWGSRSVTNSAFAAVSNNGTTSVPGTAFVPPAPAGAATPTPTAAPYNYGTVSGPKGGYAGENTQRFSINNAYLNVTADVNEWTKALAVLSYTDASMFYDQSFTSPLTNNPGNFGTMDQKLTLEQAKVHFGNFDCSPFFLDVGKQYQDFGRYTFHPITLSLSQVLSESLRNSVNLGFVTDMGIHGSVYTFQDGVYKIADANNKENTLNYGAALGYSHPDDQLGYDVGAGYMYNMFGANNVAGLIADRVDTTFVPPAVPVAVTTPGYAGYSNRVGAVAVYADLNFEAFTLGGRYTTAVQHFSAADLPRSLTNLTSGAKPWAAGIQGGYNFSAWNKGQNLYLGYQASHDTVFLNLPHNRYLVGYGIDVLKNTNLSAEWDHDNAWSSAKGGPSGGNSNLISVRAAVKFG